MSSRDVGDKMEHLGSDTGSDSGSSTCVDTSSDTSGDSGSDTGMSKAEMAELIGKFNKDFKHLR